MCFITAAIALICFFSILIDTDKPAYYSALFLLPLTYLVCVLLFSDIFTHIPGNLGAFLIIILFFVRDVISPLLLCLGEFDVTITRGIEDNTIYAILLVSYETIAVFAAMKFSLRKKEKHIQTDTIYKKANITSVYIILIVLETLALLVCQYITPVLLSTYRNIFQVGDEFFTNYEDSQVVDLYGTTFITKLSLVTGHYLVRMLTILLPAFFIIVLSKRKRLINKVLSALLCFVPLLFIGGGIARSLIYVIILFFLYNKMFEVKDGEKRTVYLLILAGFAVIGWWIFRSPNNGGTSNLKRWSRLFSSYFSGVNVVSGVFNLPPDLKYRFRYFIYDFTSTVPYGGTIFGISHETVQPFFNFYNNSFGQIPPTIGMGYYYLGPILAPLYSIVFSVVSIRCSKALNNNKLDNPFRTLRLLLMIFGFSMGIVMYNIEITMTSFFSLYLPLWIMEKISYRGK